MALLLQSLGGAKANGDEHMTDVLKGIKVLEVAQFWFVPAAGAILADWGADVIKVEHPVRGDAQRGLTVGLMMGQPGPDFLMQQSNRNKRSVGIDIGTPEGLELIYKMAAECDVFRTNFLPDARQKLKIEYEDIKKHNDKIVYVRGHGQGARGPDKEKGGYDATAFWMRGGVGGGITPEGADAPVMQRAAFGDSIGALAVAQGVMGGLFRKERENRGSEVDVSLLNTAMWTMAPDIVASKILDGGIPSHPRTSSPNPITNTYKTKDGKWFILLALQPDRYWPEVCERLERPELEKDERFKDGMQRYMNREACIAELSKTIGERTLAQWTDRFSTMETPWGAMQTPTTVHDDCQVAPNGYLQTVDTGEHGDLTLVSNPIQFDNAPSPLQRAPEMGEHTDEVLQEFGLDMDKLMDLKVKGAIL